MFDELLERVGPRNQKKDTCWRKALQPGIKLAITIRHLASGEKYHNLMYNFRVAKNTIACLIPEFLQAICEKFKDEVIKSLDEWFLIADQFKNRWNVPDSCGALDGKHVAIRCPPNSDSLYHNYKHFFSLVLLALEDADYKFLWIDCGGLGSMSDAQI
ncbi:uncharacterized protein LOC132760538 [Ruditapes philippinarum]|uniref:uncharacterized protein LOC132760538 n=1 Tax=Ruditapes philippinarum TaxID=129788 RepID=UPI00295B27E7|nr:uncharacterized protein LOC132760538 [Ruditapes philippinarum]